MAVYELLASGRSDEALQGELFELLGPERFDFILEILRRRANIVAVTQRNMPQRVHPSMQMEKARQPAIAGQVSILSAEEKRMLKAQRKESRRYASVFVNGGGGGGEGAGNV